MLHSAAKEYGVRPSQMAGIQDDWIAYQFDLAVMTVAYSKEKPDGLASVSGIAAQTGTRIRKMKIPESGIW